uniref:Uncharacterized protein n=1 Tax=Romanomermis culicivorax TaxID=13658 RepID=A0A915K3G0_ROMCU
MNNKSKSQLNDKEKIKKKLTADCDRKPKESRLRTIIDKMGLTNAKFKSTDLVTDTDSSKKVLAKSKSTSSEGSSKKKSKTKKSTIVTATSSSATKKSTPSLPSLTKTSDEKSSTGDETSKKRDGAKSSKATRDGATHKTPRFPIMREVKIIRGLTEFFNLEDYKTPNQDSALKSRTETQNTDRGASKTSYCNVNVLNDGQDTVGDEFWCQNNKRKLPKKVRSSSSVKYTYGKMGPQKETSCTKWSVCGFCGVVVLGVVLILTLLYFTGVVKSTTLNVYSTTTTSNFVYKIATKSGFYPAIPPISASTDSDFIDEDQTIESSTKKETQAIVTWLPQNRTILDKDDNDRLSSSTISKSSSSSTSRSTKKLIFNVTKLIISNSTIVTSPGGRYNETTVQKTTATSYYARTSSLSYSPSSTSDNAIPYFNLKSTRRDVASPTNDTSTNVKVATTTAK